jgi:hypothetical protein
MVVTLRRNVARLVLVLFALALSAGACSSSHRAVSARTASSVRTAAPPTVPKFSPVLSLRRPASQAVTLTLDVSNESALLEAVRRRQPGCAADQSFRLDVLADGRGLLPDLLTPRQPLEGFFAPSAERPNTFITWAWTDDRYTELIYVVVVRANDPTATSAAFLIDGVPVDHTSLKNRWGVLAFFAPHRPDNPNYAINGVLQVTGSAGNSEFPVSSQDPGPC